jgi:hypothetical protein
MTSRIALLILLLSQISGLSQGFRSRPVSPGALDQFAKFIYETPGYPHRYLAGGLVSDTLQGKLISRLGLMGLDQDGKVLWQKKIGDGTYQYLFNFMVRRSFYKQDSFIYHACAVSDTSGKNYGALIKFDLNGDTLWQKIYRDSDPWEDVVPQMLTPGVDGGFLITGYFQHSGPIPYRKTMLIKTDAHGQELWRKKIGNNVQDGRAIIQDSISKKIVIVGSQHLHGTNPYDNVVILDSVGNMLYQYGYNSVGGGLLDLIQTQDKYLVGVGVKLYPQTIGGTKLSKAFIIKFDINHPFKPLWRIDDHGPLVLRNSFNCLYELENGDFLIGGDLDTLQIKNITINYYHRLTRLDRNGQLKWEQLYDYRTDTSGIYAFHEQSLTSLQPGSNGSILASFQLYNPGTNPFFFVKYDSLGCDSTLDYCTALLAGLGTDLTPSSQLRLYPNPAREQLTIETDLDRPASLIISDVSGREVKRLVIEPGKTRIDLQELSPGLYFLNRPGETPLRLIKE